MSSSSPSIYLRKVELSNFRAYGDSFTLTLPDGPGITLICGPNGLGKTTLFDGIEWCLTGTISRFSPYLGPAAAKKPQHLTRFGAPKGSHRVSLYFTGLEPIDRGLGLAPEASQVAHRLKQASWPEVSDLARYLSITHFLGQSAAQRFSVKKAKEQWEALRGPAGVDQINHIQDRIGGNATRQAFTRYIKQATSNLEIARQALSEWDLLIQRTSRLRQLSLASRAVPPAAVLEMCDAVARMIQTAPHGMAHSFVEKGVSAEVALGQTNTLLVEAEQSYTADQRRNAAMAALSEAMEASRSDSRSMTELEAQADADYALAAEAERHEEQSLSATLVELDRVKEAARTAEGAVLSLSRVSEASETLQNALARLSTAEEDLARVEEEAVALEARGVELVELTIRAEQRAHRRQSLGEGIVRLRAARPLMQELEAIQLDTIELELTASRDALRELGSQKSALRRQEQELVLATDSVTEQLAAADQRNGAIAAAVTQIASLLRESDTACPVCSTQFAIGELVAAVRGAADLSRKDGAEELGEQLARLRVSLNGVTQQYLELDSREAVLTGRQSTLEGMRAQWSILHQQLTELAEGRSLSSSADLDALIGATEAELNLLDSENEQSPGLDELRAESTSNEATRRALHTRTDHLRAERAFLTSTVEQSKATLEQHSSVWSSESGLSEAFERIRKEAASSAAAAKTAIDAQMTHVAQQREQVEATRRECAELLRLRDGHRSRLLELASHQRELVAAWTAAGMVGEPEPAALRREQDRLQQQELALAQAVELLETAVTGYRAWGEDEELAECERKVAQFQADLGVDDEGGVTEALQQRASEADDALDRAVRAKQQVDEVVAQLQVEADQYASSVLQPLTAVIAEFADVLMTRGDGSLAYRAEHHSNRPEFKAGFVRRTSDGTAESVDMNPNLFFSEGQLSALSVSALLAASTSFPWSRWPALLMDDPLQHNDVIHASAFIDLLNSLVKEANYQVVVSTHDTAEADYIARKCRGAGIAFERCDLPTRSRGGIVSF